jgi:hypothetical protein
MAEMANPSLVTAEQLNARPRGGFSFDLFARDAKLGSSMKGAGQVMPAAMKTG